MPPCIICQVSCCGRPCFAAGEVRIGIFAKEDVLPGVEITYDYMFQHGGLAAAAAAYRQCHPATLPSAQAVAAQCLSATTSLKMKACVEPLWP